MRKINGWKLFTGVAFTVSLSGFMLSLFLLDYGGMLLFLLPLAMTMEDGYRMIAQTDARKR